MLATRPPSHTAAIQVRPFVKWAGGKRQLLPFLTARLPRHFGCYHEPFVGGGALYFHLQPRQAYLSDANRELMRTYQVIRDHLPALITLLQTYTNDAALYYQIRAQDPQQLSAVAAAARTLFLNRVGYNGLYRVNQRGLYNVPFGNHKNPRICNTLNLQAAAHCLQSATLRCQSVFNIAAQVQAGDLVYFDPPYDPLSTSAKFTAYTAEGFGRDQQTDLRDLFAQLAQRRVHVILSNADTPFIRRLYRGFHLSRVQARRGINCSSQKRQAISELLITPRPKTSA